MTLEGHAFVRPWLDACFCTGEFSLADVADAFDLALRPCADSYSGDGEHGDALAPVPAPALPGPRPVIPEGSPLAVALHPVPAWYDYLSKAARQRCELPAQSE